MYFLHLDHCPLAQQRAINLLLQTGRQKIGGINSFFFFLGGVETVIGLEHVVLAPVLASCFLLTLLSKSAFEQQLVIRIWQQHFLPHGILYGSKCWQRKHGSWQTLLMASWAGPVRENFHPPEVLHNNGLVDQAGGRKCGWKRGAVGSLVNLSLDWRLLL